MKRLLVLAVFALYTLLFATNSILNGPAVATSSGDLYNKIVEYATTNNTEAVESKCDLVWKLIPGVNGKVVDVDASLEAMSELNEFNEELIVFEEVEIENSYTDLNCGPIYKGNSSKNTVTFIINVAWGEEYIEPMLETLDKYDVDVNFFIEGNFAKNNTELVSEIYKEGHLIGNHSLDHSDFATLSKEEIHRQILETNTILTNITLEEVEFFGPPSGSFTEDTIEVTNDLNIETVMWSIDTIDWQNPSVDTIINRVTSKVEPGSIILMHPTENTAAALEELILEISKRGLEIDRLDNLLSPSQT